MLSVRRLFGLAAGAALVAALILAAVAIGLSLALARQWPRGIVTQATVLDRALLPAGAERAFAVSTVTLLINDPALGVFTVQTPHPPATLADVWVGGPVAVAVTPANPPVVAFVPQKLARQRFATLIALAVAAGFTALFGLMALFTPRTP